MDLNIKQRINEELTKVPEWDEFFHFLLELVGNYNLNYFTVSGFPSKINLDDSTIQDFISKGIFEVVATNTNDIVVVTTIDHGLIEIVALGCQISPDNIDFKNNLETDSKFYIKIPIISQVFQPCTLKCTNAINEINLFKYHGLALKTPGSDDTLYSPLQLSRWLKINGVTAKIKYCFDFKGTQSYGVDWININDAIKVITIDGMLFTYCDTLIDIQKDTINEFPIIGYDKNVLSINTSYIDNNLTTPRVSGIAPGGEDIQAVDGRQITAPRTLINVLKKSGTLITYSNLQYLHKIVIETPNDVGEVTDLIKGKLPLNIEVVVMNVVRYINSGIKSTSEIQ